MSIIAYTYLVEHKHTGQRYYGVRYAEGCSPSDLWSTYFTSSKKVQALIHQDGADSFNVHIRKTSVNKTDAINWEARVLRRVTKFDKYLNECSWPAVSQEARKRGHATKRGISEDGLTGYQRATLTWLKKRHTVNPESGKTYEQERIEKCLETRKRPDSVLRNLEASRKTSKRMKENNPSKNPEIRSKMTKTLLQRFADGTLTTTKGRKFPEISKKLKGKQFTLGKLWFNDGVKNQRFSKGEAPPGFVRGRIKLTLGAACKGFVQEKIVCPHCKTSGGKSNMTRYHFTNCKKL